MENIHTHSKSRKAIVSIIKSVIFALIVVSFFMLYYYFISIYHSTKDFDFKKIEGGYELRSVNERLLNSAEITIPEEVLGKPVVSIGYFAFSDLKNVNIIKIPSTINSIESYFAGCNNLEYIIVDENNTTFKSIDGILFNKSGTKLIKYPNGKKETAYSIPSDVQVLGAFAFSGSALAEIEINDSMVTIESQAFSNCAGLTSMVIPDSVTSIGARAFYNCTNLTSISFPLDSNLTSLGGGLFSECSSLEDITLPNTIESISDSMFKGCTALTSIVIPDNVKRIEIGAFNGCTSLETVTFNENSQLTEIGDWSFSLCEALTTFTIPEGVTTMGIFVFSSCINLESIFFPASITDIDSTTFYKCTSLKNITVDENNNHLIVIDNVLFDITETSLILYPKGSKRTLYVVPSGVIDIREGAFRDSNNLHIINLPSSLVTMEWYVFYGCSSLKYIFVDEENPLYTSISGVLFDKSVTRLKHYPAGNSRTTYTVPASVTEILFPFNGCKNLTSIYIERSVNNGRITIQSGLYYDCPSLETIYVADAFSREVYIRDSFWKEYADKIQVKP